MSPMHLATVIQKTNVHTPLFRLLFVKQHGNDNSIALARNLLVNIENKDHPVAFILQQFLLETADIKPKDAIVKNEGKNMMSVFSSDTSDLGIRLAEQLLKNTTEPEKTGVLVDWLSAVELEIVNFKQEHVQVEPKRLVFVYMCLC